jgi:predicted branched-subunit amino acid permease
MVTLSGTFNAPAPAAIDEIEAQAPAAGAIRAGLADVLPIFAGVAPFGLALGVAIGDSAVNDTAGWAGSVLMFSGSAHMAVISVLGAGGGVIAVLMAALLVNARLAIYSALLAPEFRRQPRWFRWTAPYFVLDQTYVLVTRRIEDGSALEWVRRYYMVIGLAILALWPPLIAVGVLAGPVIPSSWNLAFAMPLLIAGMLAPGLVNRTALVVAAVAAAVAVPVVVLPGGLGLVVATAAGTAAGIAMERWGR